MRKHGLVSMSRPQNFQPFRPRTRKPRASRPASPLTPLTLAAWPSNVRNSRPVSRSHTFSVLSLDAEIALFPSAVHRHTMDIGRVALQGVQGTAGLQVPNLKCFVPEAETARVPSGVTART